MDDAARDPSSPTRLGTVAALRDALDNADLEMYYQPKVSLADGTDLAAQKLERVLTNGPAMGVIRHVDAGYDIAERTAAEQGVRVPMRES